MTNNNGRFCIGYVGIPAGEEMQLCFCFDPMPFGAKGILAARIGRMEVF